MPSASVRPPATSADVLPRLHIRDPDVLLVLIAWVTIVFSVLQILLFGYGRDQSIYALIGEAIQQGQMPYRDVWDFKPPGIHLIYAAAQALFGNTMLAPRLVEVLGLCFSIYAFTQLSHALLGLKRIGLIGGALAALLQAQLEFWHTAQPETFGGYATIFALLLSVREHKRTRRWPAWLLIGALCGAAFLLKPPLGGGALVCAAYLARGEFSEKGTRVAALMPGVFMILGGALPLIAVGLWFYIRGAWPALAWTFFEFTPGYTNLGWQGQSAPEMFYMALEEAFFRFSALAAAGVIATLAISPMHEREREGIFLVLGLVSVQLAGIAMQGKFFPYHYGATLPLIAFIAGIGLYKLWRRCLAGGAGGVVAYCSFLIVVTTMRQGARDLESFWVRSAIRLDYLLGSVSVVSREMLERRLYTVADFNLSADRRVAREVERLSDERDSIYVWGFEPAIYTLSERKPASRFIYNVPQRVSWISEEPRHELMRALTRKPPAVIIVQRNDTFRFVTGDDLDSRGALAQFPELRRMIGEHYELAKTIEDFEIYQRRQ